MTIRDPPGRRAPLPAECADPVPETETDTGPDALRRWLARAAAAKPEHPYLVMVDDGRAISYAALRRTALRIAGYLGSRGIGANDRVALLANNSLEHLAVYLGVLAAGATICTIHVEMNRAYFDAILAALSPRLVIYEEGLGLEALAARTSAPWQALGRWEHEGGQGFFADVAAGPAPAAGSAGSAADDAVIFFTSGTSARPKGVVLTYRELLANATATAAAFDLGPDDRIYDYRSFNWASAQILSALATLSQGATLYLGRKFSRSHYFGDIARFRITIAAGNPTILNLLLQAPEPVRGEALPHLRFITSSSAPLLVEEWRRFEERFGIAIAQGYGTSETGWIAGCSDKTRRFGSVGKPLPYHRLRIVGSDGRRCPPGETGQVEVGGFEGNAYRYVAEDGAIRINAVGRTRTGDLGFVDADGYLYLTGREKELIIRGGVNISPLEIDNVLLQMPGVAEAATIGVPDRIYGEEVVSYVVLAPGAGLAASDILRFCAERIAAFKAPKQILLCADLPKTERGKLDRKALGREWQRAGRGSATTT
jgi:acyl-coenzyme A synthetase/AMP-(fatty) acid ligase